MPAVELEPIELVQLDGAVVVDELLGPNEPNKFNCGVVVDELLGGAVAMLKFMTSFA